MKLDKRVVDPISLIVRGFTFILAVRAPILGPWRNFTCVITERAEDQSLPRTKRRFAIKQHSLCEFVSPKYRCESTSVEIVVSQLILKANVGRFQQLNTSR